MTSPAPDPGWLPDPWDARRERYWDGAEWAPQWRVRERPSQKPTPVRPVPPTQKAGWYPDPSDSEQEVYWDGSRWHGRRVVEPGYVPPPARSSPIDDVHQGWYGLSRQQLVILAVLAVVVGCALLAITINLTSDSPIEKDCKATARANGYTGSEADTFVKFCVRNAQ